MNEFRYKRRNKHHTPTIKLLMHEFGLSRSFLDKSLLGERDSEQALFIKREYKRISSYLIKKEKAAIKKAINTIDQSKR